LWRQSQYFSLANASQKFAEGKWVQKNDAKEPKGHIDG